MSVATLNGHRVTDGCATLHDWGCWYAEASLDAEVALTGRVTLTIADLALQGTVLSGGPSKGRSDYWIVAGAGGWGRTIRRDSSASDAGVKVTKVIGDAARLAGETFEASSSQDRVGPAWTRPEGPASRVLELLAPHGWYVGEDGVTRLGKRPSRVLPANVTRTTPVDLARGTVVLASDAIAGILPGVVVDGLTAVDVKHEISPKGLRSTVWGARAAAGTSRGLEVIRALIEQLFPDLRFRGYFEYRVVSQEGALLNLQPVLKSLGMPDLPRVRVMPGLPGCLVTPKLGSRVSVSFLNGDPALPRVVGFESDVPSLGLELATDGIGAGGHAITAEQVLGLFAQYTAARVALAAEAPSFIATYAGAPQATLAALLLAMTGGAVLPSPIGPLPGGDLTALGLPALVATALLAQLPDPASAGLPVPVFPGLAKKGLKL